MKRPTSRKTTLVWRQSLFGTCEKAQQCSRITSTWGVLAELPERESLS